MVGKFTRTKVHLTDKNGLFCGRPQYENGHGKFVTSGNALVHDNMFWCPECKKVADERGITLLTPAEWRNKRQSDPRTRIGEF